MTEPTDSIGSLSGPTQSASGRWRYFALFGMQTIGIVSLYWKGIPIYRQALADPGSHEVQPLVWLLSSIALIQVGYWVAHQVRPALPQFTNVLLGHVILFLARMGFVLATSVFGFVFIAQQPEFQIPAFRYVVILFGLFSVYCYQQELERLGRALLSTEKGLQASAR
jgi:hypothetical protein